mmetsp:Transcript_26651/g.68851  ORF Transcript_26651/g.68851 Transcript_26651/m.68851 type:complete len:320 (-) Transcript_26651:56-1015(-)
MCCGVRGCALSLAVFFAAAASLPFFLRVEYPVNKSGIVIITGTSSGIGKAAAYRLASDGYQVYAGVRSEKDGSKLRSGAPSAAGDRIEPVILDVTNSSHIRAVIHKVAAADQPLVAVVNNAGLSPKKPLETSPLSDVRWSFDVMYFGVLDLIQQAIPLLRQSRGRIIVVGSVSGIVTLPMGGTYSSIKYATEAMSDALRLELGPARISVSMVNPAYVNTAITGRALEQMHQDEFDTKFYSALFEKVQRKARDRVWASPCCAVTDDAIAHAVQDPYPMTRYYPAVVAPSVPAIAAVPVIKLLSIHPVLDRASDWIKATLL